jgi:hypothetical protein
LSLEALSVSEDEQQPRQRRASERAVDPVARTFLATAEGHQDYCDKVEDLLMPLLWRDWLANWILSAVGLVSGGFALVAYFAYWIPLALPLGLILLVMGGAALAYPFTQRRRKPVPSKTRKG